MLPLLVGFDTFVEIITPINGLVEHLLDAQPLHLLLVLQNIVEDALPH